MTRERELELRRMTAAMWEVLLGAKRFGWICQPWMRSANILVRRRPHRDRARRRDVFMTCMYVIKLDSLDLAGNHVEKKAVQISRFGTGSGIGDGGLTN